MKFRAKMFEITAIQYFSKTVTVLSKFASVIILRITEDHLYFIMNDQVNHGGTRLWCELTQACFFQEYIMQGVSEDFNEIFLEIEMDHLVQALKLVQNPKSLKIKLSKKHTPCLTLEAELPSLVSSSRSVVHDVPVSVVPRKMWSNFQEPEVPEADVAIYLPPLKVLKNVIDGMKNLSSFGEINITAEGEMTLSVQTDVVEVTTHFKDIEFPSERTDESQYEARIDFRKLIPLLAAQQLNPMHVICKIVQKKMAHFIISHDNMALQYFMPCVYS